jgi:hypothetical protein
MGNPLLQKKGNPGAIAVNNAGNPGHGTMPGDDPALEHTAAAQVLCGGCGEPIAQVTQRVKQGPGLRVYPEGKKTFWTHLFEGKPDPTSTYCVDENGHTTGLEAYPAETKVGREVMHDDFGAQTGLRRRPDYGESDSLTSTLNRENSKGASYHVAVYNSFGTKEATNLLRYIASVEWAGSRVENVTLSFDQSKAARFPAFTARALNAQLTHPEFALTTAIIKA